MDPALDTLSDAELLSRSSREAAAFECFYVRHADGVHDAILRRSYSRVDAADMTAEVFARVWIDRRRFRPPADGSAGGWLHGIAKNVYREWVDGRAREYRALKRIGYDTTLPTSSLDDAVSLDSDDPHTVELIQTLPDEQAQAVTWRVIDDLSYEAVAARMSCSEDTARMRVSRGLRTIKAKLQEATR